MSPDNSAVDELSVFFPAYNEEQNVEFMIRETSSILEKLVNIWEIIIVDDGSTDCTAEITRRISAIDNRIRLVSHSCNLGFGRAIRTGISESRYKWIFYTDCDGQFDLSQLEEAVESAGEGDVVSGFRRKRNDPGLRILYSFAYNSLISILFWKSFKDVDTSFKLYRKSIFKRVKPLSTTGVVDFEILYLAYRFGYRVKQFPVRHFPRRAGTVSFETVRKGFFAWVKVTAIRDMWLELWGLRVRTLKGNV